MDMNRSDLAWLGMVAVSLAAGVVGGSYMKKDELLPICHALAPGLFPAISVALRTDQGVFDSGLMYADQPIRISFVGPDCQQDCQAHLALANQADVPHLHVYWESGVHGWDQPYAVGHSIEYLQAAESLGLAESRWSMSGYVATWQLNADHHIEQRWVNSVDPTNWAN